MTSSSYLSSQELARLLIDPSGSTRPSTEPKYTYHSSAPAQIDGNRSFYFPKKSCFLQPEFSRGTTGLQKRIIHSNPLLAEQPLTEDERDIWNAIFDSGYEVILNPSPGTSIENCKPIKNVNDFFRLRGTAYPATVTATKQVLKTQGLNPNQYITLDMNEWSRVRLQYSASKNPDPLLGRIMQESTTRTKDNSDILDLCDLTLSTEKIKKLCLLLLIQKQFVKLKCLLPALKKLISFSPIFPTWKNLL